MTILAAILLCLNPASIEPVRDRCAVIELNHFYDEAGRLVFSQFIFRQPCEIIAWRMVKPGYELFRTEGGWSLLWTDDRFRRVDAMSFRETWTQFDPEVLERETLPNEERRELKAGLN